MQIFFDELKPYDKPDETLYLRFTKEDFPGLRKQFKYIYGELMLHIVKDTHKNISLYLSAIKALEQSLLKGETDG